MKPKVGDEITIVSKGIVHGYGKPYVDSGRKGKAFFLKVTKVGRKYIHGHIIYFDADDGRKLRDTWTDQYSMEDYIVYEGIRRDLDKAYRTYIKNSDDYDKARRSKRSELESQAREWVSKEMDKWTETHPYILNNLA